MCAQDISNDPNKVKANNEWHEPKPLLRLGVSMVLPPSVGDSLGTFPYYGTDYRLLEEGTISMDS